MNDPYQAPHAQPSVSPESAMISTSNVEQTSQSVAKYFSQQKYRLESGTPENGAYGIGSNVMRILFGAWRKRYKFQVTITPLGEGSQVILEKAMSGAMGGVIGHSKMKKEFVKVTDQLRSSLNG